MRLMKQCFEGHINKYLQENLHTDIITLANDKQKNDMTVIIFMSIVVTYFLPSVTVYVVFLLDPFRNQCG